MIATRDSNFTLSDALLTIVPGGTFNLFSIEGALLTGGGSTNTIDASGFTGTTTLKGEGDPDTITGGQGPDTDLWRNRRRHDRCGSGNDLLIWNDGDGDDTIEGRGGSTDEVRVTASALPEDFAVTANGSDFRVQRTNQTPYTINIGGG